ncbi:hypothetical protein [Mesorhizobium sp. CA16]|uniref:hypothetical protein n=1 Tax=Mesorhizobium sp. CA16 TaxID=588496 RepID=UPI001CCB9856|nr:hypothetical protein [Mesorhizobium sp. CA16]MBZ9912408.1 hypothetical protein [Mesorhizobium sp. CA16]
MKRFTGPGEREMQPDWYPAWRDEAFEQLIAKNARLAKDFRLGSWSRYDYDLTGRKAAVLRPEWSQGRFGNPGCGLYQRQGWQLALGLGQFDLAFGVHN